MPREGAKLAEEGRRARNGGRGRSVALNEHVGALWVASTQFRHSFEQAIGRALVFLMSSSRVSQCSQGMIRES